MGRLIDADDLIEVMTDVYKKHYAGDVSASGFTIAMEMVRKQPTAYNVKKVVAELEEMKGGIPRTEEDWNYCGALDEAIDIVKRGGVDGKE